MDIFISYNWSLKEHVVELDKNLKNSGYTVWRDENELVPGKSMLAASLANGILKSKIFLCCITKEYCSSYNCNLEIEFASTRKKQIIVLMIERLDDIDEIQINGRNLASGVGFIIK